MYGFFSHIKQYDINYLELAQAPQFTCSVPQNCPSLQITVASSGFPGYLYSYLTWLQIHGSYDSFSGSLISYNGYRTQKNTISYYQFIVTHTQINSQVKRYIGQGLEDSQVQELLSLWSLSVPPSQHMDAFIKLEGLQNHVFRVFMVVPLLRHDELIFKPFSSP